MDIDKLREQLKRHEGIRLYPYIDTVGKTTIGVGRNLTDRGITPVTVLQMLDEDVQLILAELIKLPWFNTLSEVRQRVIADMAFNMGVPKLLTFYHMIVAILAENYIEAAHQMLDSQWAQQVGLRANELANMMRSGIDV